MLGHLLAQRPSLDASDAGIALDPTGVEQPTARRAALERPSLEHAAARVHRGAHAGRSRPNDDDVVLVGFRHPRAIPVAGDHPPPPGPASTDRGTARFRTRRPDSAGRPASVAPRHRPRPRRADCSSGRATTPPPLESTPATPAPRLGVP